MQDGGVISPELAAATPATPPYEPLRPEETDFLGGLWKSYQTEEARPADPNEVITIGELSPENSEYTTLIAVGVSATDLEQGRVTRQQLLDAGFVFNNRPVPGMEKPLLKGAGGGI